MFYALDGELIDEIKYIKETTKILLVSQNKDYCLGLSQPESEDNMNIKEQRIANAIKTKQFLQEISIDFSKNLESLN